MPITLTVTAPGDPPSENAYAFDADQITIGRGSGSTLVLPDPKRVVSKEHAVLVRTPDGYTLADLGSKNLTYLHGNALPPHQPAPIQSGDVFTIGEFSIRCAIRDNVAPASSLGDSDRTVFDGAYLNPFLDDAAVLAATLRSMIKAYDQEPVARRDDAVREAIRTAALQSSDSAHPESPVLQLVGDTLSGTVSPEPIAAAPSPRPRTAAPAEAVAVDPAHRVVDAMTRALAKLLSIPQQFRHEFIGQTIMQDPAVAPFYGGDPRALSRHVLETNLPPEEEERRANDLREAADTLALHHVALLEGYRASVRDGSTLLLEAMNPDADLAQEGGLLQRLFPFYRRLKRAERAAEKWNDLQASDWAAAERRVFRPAFIRAYLQRAESTGRRSGDTGGDTDPDSIADEHVRHSRS